MRGRDQVGATLLQQIESLLEQRPEEDEQRLFHAIGRNTPSWRSEFLSGKRTTNDLRLVIAIARFFRVTVSYLLNEQPDSTDAATVTLLAAWRSLPSKRDRDAVLHLAIELAREPPTP
jgi:transcriptional regulator with XRE-family HTH domain